MVSISKNPLLLINFGMLEIYSYAEKLKEKVGSHFNLFGEQKKGLLMFKEKFVYDIRSEQESDVLVIEAKVRAEMRKNVSYTTKAEILSDNKILECSCTCIAGSTPANCKHVFALLHALEEYSREELYLAPTEKIQTWHKPKKAKFDPQTCQEVFGKEHHAKVVNPVNFDALFSGNMNTQYVSILPNHFNGTVYRTPPLPACVVTQAENSWIHELPNEQFIYVSRHLSFEIEKNWEIERNTISQSESAVWVEERYHRLTGSKFYDVCVRLSDFEGLASNIISSHSKKLDYLPAVAYGIKNESLVRNHVRSLYPNHLIRKVGLVTNPLMPHLAASPDGLIYSIENFYLLEVKCIFNVKNSDIEELSLSKTFCLEKNENNEWHLKKNHRYYQVQGQLALSNLSECVFAVFYKVPNFVHTEIVLFDSSFWQGMYAKLHNFYKTYYLPSLILQRI